MTVTNGKPSFTYGLNLLHFCQNWNFLPRPTRPLHMVLPWPSSAYHRSAHELPLFYFHISHCNLPLWFSLIISLFLWSWLFCSAFEAIFPKLSMHGRKQCGRCSLRARERCSLVCIFVVGTGPARNKNPRKTSNMLHFPKVRQCVFWLQYELQSTCYEIKASSSLNG